ncbi:hypothetical protein ACWCV9_37055 [Streptomyces sp. NPDC001606]
MTGHHATALLLAMAYLTARRTRSRKAAAAWWGATLALSGAGRLQRRVPG